MGESLDMLCLRCTLPDCDRESAGCLIRITREREAQQLPPTPYGDWARGERGVDMRKLARSKCPSVRRAAEEFLGEV